MKDISPEDHERLMLCCSIVNTLTYGQGGLREYAPHDNALKTTFSVWKNRELTFVAKYLLGDREAIPNTKPGLLKQAKTFERARREAIQKELFARLAQPNMRGAFPISVPKTLLKSWERLARQRSKCQVPEKHQARLEQIRTYIS